MQLKHLSVPFGFALALLATNANAHDVNRIKKLESLKGILENLQFENVEIEGDQYIVFSDSNDASHVLVRYEDADIQLYYGVTGLEATFEDMNRWNRTKRLSRAYIDEDGDAVIESDLLADEGVSRQQVENFVRVHMMSVSDFSDFLSEIQDAPELEAAED